jgi:hypothetical protein
MFAVSLAGCSGSGNANAPATPNGPTSANTPAPTPSQSPAAVNNAVASTNAKKGACELLTSDEIKSVQGEAPQDKKGDERVEGSFMVSQCYYALSTLSKSVVLTVTSAEGGSATDLRNFWKNSFSREGEGERDRDKKAKDRDQKNERGEEREESVPPQKVTGVGEEAYWTASRVGGALYALKQHAFIRISVGGPDDQNSKLKKSKTLAQKVLKKL